jgi:AdoMet-dependent heme synthase
MTRIRVEGRDAGEEFHGRVGGTDRSDAAQRLAPVIGLGGRPGDGTPPSSRLRRQDVEKGMVERRTRMRAIDFEKSPFLVIWETTQACDLACLHCRADARAERDCRELSTAEAMRMMMEVQRFGDPLFVLTGGDPLKRPDILELVEFGTWIGLRMAMTPSGTPLMTEDVVHRLKEAGLSRLAVSLDGSTAAIHDRFRGVPGSFDWTVQMLGHARAVGLTTQINTTVTRHNLDDLDDQIRLLHDLDISLWSVFFLVPTGRARPDEVATAEEFERVFHTMYDLSKTASFDIKSTAAPQYRRVIVQRQVAERRAGERTDAPAPLTAGVGFSLADGVGRAKGVNDGDGFLFLSHTGEIFPSGFLPLSAGNVRKDDVVDVYRNSTLFRNLRNRDLLKGKCGVCEFREICGGSRARAFSMTGDYLESEPFCAHVPKRYQRMVQSRSAMPEEPDTTPHVGS